MKIQPGGTTNVILTWGTNFTGYILEANTNLLTNNWESVTPAPVVSGTNNLVVNEIGVGDKFYRLRVP